MVVTKATLILQLELTWQNQTWKSSDVSMKSTGPISLSISSSSNLSDRSPNSQPTISLSKFQIVSDMSSKTFLMALKKQILGVFNPEHGNTRIPWNAKVIVPWYFRESLRHSTEIVVEDGWCREPLKKKVATSKFSNVDSGIPGLLHRTVCAVLFRSSEYKYSVVLVLRV